MNKYFSISYRQQHPEQATINQNCSNEFLGLGFKKNCAYLQERNTFNNTFDKYNKEMDFILKTGENTSIQNNVNINLHYRLSIYKRYCKKFIIKFLREKEFAYDIDFIYLTYTKK
jgi:hypothetical protein